MDEWMDEDGIGFLLRRGGGILGDDVWMEGWILKIGRGGLCGDHGRCCEISEEKKIEIKSSLVRVPTPYPSETHI